MINKVNKIHEMAQWIELCPHPLPPDESQVLSLDINRMLALFGNRVSADAIKVT